MGARLLPARWVFGSRGGLLGLPTTRNGNKEQGSGVVIGQWLQHVRHTQVALALPALGIKLKKKKKLQIF